MTERNKNGSFYSLEEFCERISGTKVNKRCIINLILAGAFDKIEKISTNERSKLLERFTTFTGSTLPEDLQETNTKKWKEYQWVLKQKELTGFGYINYSKIVAGSNFFAAKQKKYLDIATCNSITEHEDYNDVVISGILTDLKVWQAKAKNGYWANIGILDNTETIRFMLWKNEFEKFGKLMEDSVGKIVIVNGKMAFDDYRQLNKIDSTNKTIVEVI
jgi:DNA polymerase-3 subunit alpha